MAANPIASPSVRSPSQQHTHGRLPPKPQHLCAPHHPGRDYSKLTRGQTPHFYPKDRPPPFLAESLFDRKSLVDVKFLWVAEKLQRNDSDYKRRKKIWFSFLFKAEFFVWRWRLILVLHWSAECQASLQDALKNQSGGSSIFNTLSV